MNNLKGHNRRRNSDARLQVLSSLYQISLSITKKGCHTILNSAYKDKTRVDAQNDLVQIAEGAGLTFVGRIAETVLKYLYLIIIARVLGKESSGLFWMAVAIISFAAVVSRLGLDNGVVRFIALYKGTEDLEKVKGTIVQSLKYSLGAGIIVGGGTVFSRGFSGISNFQ